MILHKLFPKHCIENIRLNDIRFECSRCGRHIAHIYEGRLYLPNGFKKYEEEIRQSRAFEEYTEQRNKMAATCDAEWRDFLRDLKFDEDEILPLETTDEWIPEDSEWGDTAGC